MRDHRDVRRTHAAVDDSPFGRLGAVVAALYTLEDYVRVGSFAAQDAGLRVQTLRDLCTYAHLTRDELDDHGQGDRSAAVLRILETITQSLDHCGDKTLIIQATVPGRPDLNPYLTLGGLRALLDMLREGWVL